VTEIPTLVTPASGVLSQSYVTAAMFSAYPHWLDLDNLVPGGIASVQADVLEDVLLQASDWAVGACETMLLHAHYVQDENSRGYAKRTGRVYVRPYDIPVRSVTSLSWGADPSYMQSVSLPDASMWFEDGRRMSWIPGGIVTQFNGPALQFGPSLRGTSRQVFIQWSYIPGFPSTSFASVAESGADSVSVVDPTGILPGDVLRIFDVDGDAGISEALTVASGYVPMVPVTPPAVTSIPLAANTQYAHQAGVGVTGMPRRLLQAVIAYGVAQLMREDVSDEAPVSMFGPAARTTESGRGGQGGGLINDAYGWLSPFRPTLRS
jgi:hypothetical protein